LQVKTTDAAEIPDDAGRGMVAAIRSMAKYRSALRFSIETWELLVNAATTPSAPPPARSPEQRAALHFCDLSSSVHRYLTYCCRNQSDAEDLTQEVFLRLYRVLQADEQIDNVRFWAFRVARNLMLDRAKQLKRRSARECELSSELRDSIADPLPTSEEVLIANTRGAVMRTAMRDLTGLQQQCLQLRAEGLRLREIAEMLDMDVRRVAEAIQRGVKNIQRAIGG
jgi:RNA polymerase sigma-70 factor, ECF subfamily